jgi:D-galacturonate reductase
MGHNGEINVDQAHRGYTLATDANGFKSANPLFMKYTPRDGKFAGQNGYGYKSLEHFIRSATKLAKKEIDLQTLDKTLPTIANTALTTAILEAGRRSLEEKSPIFLKNL